MPLYDYEHLHTPCDMGAIFEVYQRIHESALSLCPHCGTPVRKRISAVTVSVPKLNAELRDLGMTKLVKRDDGIYENMTRRQGESRYMERGKAESLPHLHKIIPD
jgi:putative FmdB family regulatory protein